MSAHRATNLSQRRRKSQPVHEQAEPFLPRLAVAVAREMMVVLPVPVLDWPSNLFSEVHSMEDDDWIDDVLSMRDRPHSSGWAPQHDHAGVAL